MRAYVIGLMCVASCGGKVANEGVVCCPISASNDDACNGIEIGGTKGDWSEGACSTIDDGTPRAYVLTVDSNGCPIWGPDPVYGSESCLTSWWPDTADAADTIDIAESAEVDTESVEAHADTPVDGPTIIVTETGVTCCAIITNGDCNAPLQNAGAPVNETCPPGAWDVPPPWLFTNVDSSGCPFLDQDSSRAPGASCFPATDTSLPSDANDTPEGTESTADGALESD